MRVGRWVVGGAAAVGAAVMALPLMLFVPAGIQRAEASPEPPPADAWPTYQAAAATCPGLPAFVLAAIGKIESGHGTHRRTLGRILGPALDGTGDFALIFDTDGGLLDLDPIFDRAVGPMQFLPKTWARYGRDGNGDGTANPQDFADAVHAAAAYLCANGGGQPGGLDAAILRYNHSDEYLADVKEQAAKYEAGVVP